MKYLSNNQIFLLGALMDAKIPINFHFSTQALTSSLKPDSEQYNQNFNSQKITYIGIFGTSLKTS